MQQRPHRSRRDNPSVIAQALFESLLPPLPVPRRIHLRPHARPFFDGIIGAKLRSEWTEAQLMLAADLAHVMHDLVRVMSSRKARFTRAQRLQRRDDQAALLALELRLLRALGISGCRAPLRPRVPVVPDDGLFNH